MAFTAALNSNLPTSSSYNSNKFWSWRLNGKQKRLAIKTALLKRGHSLKAINSVLNNKKSSFNDNGATEPTRILLERLFAQTQKLEERMNGDSQFALDENLIGLNLEGMESDLLAALAALQKKEEDLQDAESMVFSEHTELTRAKEELERREAQIAVVSSKQEKLEEDLKHANINLASQARQIEELKLQLREKDGEMLELRSLLDLKEAELEKMKDELVMKSKEASLADSELKLKARLLNEANGVVKKQELEVLDLCKTVTEREEELEMYKIDLNVEEDKLKIAENNLEKRTMEYLLVQDELKKLAEQANNHFTQTNETMEDFKRVRKLLSDVRSELVSSQESLVSSRGQMEYQEKLLEKQLKEVEVQKTSVMSYMKSLKDAQMEIESERVRLRIAEARNKELERDLLLEKELTEDLQSALEGEKSSLQQTIREVFSLQEELDTKNTEFTETHQLLLTKEAELVESKLEIQHLKSEYASLQVLLEERDSELLKSQEKLKELNQEIVELKILMNSREKQLLQAASTLKEKEQHTQMIELELNTTKLKVSEAESVVERIAELTNKLVESIKDEHDNVMSKFDNSRPNQPSSVKPISKYEWKTKQLESELQLTRESLKTKEMEVLASQRSLLMKQEELEMVIQRLEERENEIRKLKHEMVQDGNDLKKLHSLAQETLGEKSIGNLAIEKLQLESAQLEVEAATSALSILAEMSQELLRKASASIETDFIIDVPSHGSNDSTTSVVVNEVKTEVARLSALTDQLVYEAGIFKNDLR